MQEVLSHFQYELGFRLASLFNMFACNVCSSADPTSDTVKVNFDGLAANETDKENQGANQQQSKESEQALKEKAAREEEEKRRRAEAEAERLEKERRMQEQKRRDEEAARKAEEARKVAEAQRQAEAEEQARHMEEMRRQAADAERKRVEEQAKKAKEEADAKRMAEEAEQERMLQEQEAADKAKLEAFLKEHGYKGANEKRTKMFKTKYPLHTAVKVNDPDMVRILLAAGADAGAKNSAGQTPAQLAQKSDKSGSHAALLLALDSM